MASLVTFFERAFWARPSPRHPQTQSSTAQPVAEPAIWALRVVVALQCLGAAWAATRSMSDIGGTLFFEWGLSESVALWVEKIGIGLMVGAAAAVLAFRTRVVPAIVALWFFGLAVTQLYRGGAAFTDWTLGAHAVRYLAPAALALLIRPFPTSVRASTTQAPEHNRRVADTLNWLLRAAAAATFLIHGLEALSQHPRFVDYLLVAADRLLGYELAEPVARKMLLVIGTMDVVLASLVLLRRKWRWVLLWMAFWGLVTASARIVFGGWDLGFMTLVRAANAGVPLALYLWVTVSTKGAERDVEQSREVVDGSNA